MITIKKTISQNNKQPKETANYSLIKWLCIICFFCNTKFVASQTYTKTIKFTEVEASETFKDKIEVTKSDLNLPVYDKDSTANAVVLYEYGISSLNRGTLNLSKEVSRKIKIFNKEGFEYGNVSILLYGNGYTTQYLSRLKAYTHNLENDSIVSTKLEKDQIFIENFDGASQIAKFTFPNLKSGSVITYSYKIISPFIYNFESWYFQDIIPKVTSEYVSSIPADWNYNTKLVGGLKINKMEKVSTPKCINEFLLGSKKTPCENIIFQINDIPAFEGESYLSSKENYISKLEYELNSIRTPKGKVLEFSNNWELVDQQIQESTIGKLLKKRSYIKNLVPKELKKTVDKLEKAKKIFHLIQNDYTWNSDYKSINDNLKSLIKSKSGSAFEINSLLFNALNLNDIEAYPMLISTRENGLPTKLYPVVTDFNYLIVHVKINDKVYFLDATNKYIPFGELPFRCLNQYGRVLDFEKISYWEDINIEKYSTIQYRIKLELLENDLLTGSLQNKTTGYASHGLRDAYFENENIYKEFIKELYNGIVVENHNVLTDIKTDNQFEEELDISYEPDFVGDKLYFNPFIFKFFDENPFRLTERNYPIDFGFKNIYQYSMEIDLKDHLKIVEIPDPVNIALPNGAGTATFSTTAKENKLTVFLKIKFNEAIYQSNYYESLKLFMSKVVEIQNNTVIVLEKQ